MNRVLFVLYLSLGYVFANEVDSTFSQPKIFEWRMGLHYDVNFTSFSNRKLNYGNSNVSGPTLRLGFLIRPASRFSFEFASGIGLQMTSFHHNGKKNQIAEADLAYVESLFSGQQLTKIKDAMLTGDLRNVWDMFDWTKLNYDYIDRGNFDKGITSYNVPFEARFNYHINNDWVTYLGGVYNKGGLIEDARVFVGATYKYFDARLGYVAYINTVYKGKNNQQIRREGGVPLSLTIGAVW